MRNEHGTTNSNYFLSLLFHQLMKMELLCQIFISVSFYSSVFELRINSANGLEIKSTEGQSSLTVTNVTEEHYGNYTCVAANKLGVTNASLVLFSKYPKAGPVWEHLVKA